MADDPYKRSRPSPRLNHLDPVTDRQLTDGLLDLSLQGDDAEALMLVADAPGLISGWEITASCPKLDTLDLHTSRSEAANDESVSPGSRRLANRETKYNSDGETFERTPWKAYVEPTTYRYLPSNGMYRTAKFTRKLEPPKADRKRPAERLTPKQRQLQKEIQRDLRQEFEMFRQYEKEMEHKMKSGKGNSRERSEESDDFRGENKQPDDETDTTGKLHVRSRSPLQLPAICVPLVRKSSDQWYLENFDSRLAVLDQEMQRDRFMYRRAKDFVKAVTSGSRSQSETPHLAPRRLPDLGGFPAITSRYNSGVDDLAESLISTKDSQECRNNNSAVCKLSSDNNEKCAATNAKKVSGSLVITSVSTSVRDRAEHGGVDETLSVLHISKHSKPTEKHRQLDTSSGNNDKRKGRKSTISSSASSSVDGQMPKKSHARNTSRFSAKTDCDSTGETSSLVVKRSLLQPSSTSQSPSCESSMSGTQTKIKAKRKIPKKKTATVTRNESGVGSQVENQLDWFDCEKSDSAALQMSGVATFSTGFTKNEGRSKKAIKTSQKTKPFDLTGSRDWYPGDSTSPRAKKHWDRDKSNKTAESQNDCLQIIHTVTKNTNLQNAAKKTDVDRASIKNVARRYSLEVSTDNDSRHDSASSSRFGNILATTRYDISRQSNSVQQVDEPVAELRGSSEQIPGAFLSKPIGKPRHKKKKKSTRGKVTFPVISGKRLEMESTTHRII